MMTRSGERRLVLPAIVCAAIGVMANVYPGKVASESEGMTGSQDVRTLDRRISSLVLECSESRRQAEAYRTFPKNN
jgi:hypothetical protein